MQRQKKQLLVMAGLLAAVIAAYLLAVRFGGTETEEERARYEVTGLAAQEVTRLVFTNADGTVALTKSGDTWKCDDDSEAEIDGEAVEGLLENVAQLSSEDRIENVEDLGMYGLEEPAKTVMISDGDRKYTIFVGDINSVTDMYYIYLEEKPDCVYTVERSVADSFDVTMEDLAIT